MTRPLEQLGHDVALALGEPNEAARRQRQKQAIVEAMMARRRNRRVTLWGVGVLATAVAALIVFFAAPTREPVDFWVGAENTASSEGVALRAPPADALPVRFAEGSELVFAADSQAKVRRASNKAASIELVRGRVRASVRHGTGVAWDFLAGGYRVVVTGTRLAVSLNRGDFAVEVEDGAVRVSGPGLGGEQVVHTGERLHASGTSFQLERPSAPVLAPPEPSPAPKTLSPPPVRVSPPRRETPARSSAPAEPGWRVYAERGEYDQAVKRAKEQGLADLVTDLDASGLLLLADAARFARDAGSAHLALEALSRRFPHSREGERAPFLSGRVAWELEGDAAAATRWFRLYLTRSPSGAFAEEALGRLLDTLAKAGDTVAAQQEAQRYLERYPRGSYAALARSLTAR